MRLVLLHPENNDRYGWHDMGNGYLFADWYKDKARYVPERKKWFVYTGKRWKVGRFVDEEMEPDPLGETRTAAAYSRYQTWCAQNGYFPESSANFKAALENIGTVERRRPRTGGDKTSLFIGYKLKFPESGSPSI